MRHYVAVQAESGLWFYANEGFNRAGEAGWKPAGACGTIMTCPDCQGRSFLSVDEPDCATCQRKGAIKNPSPCSGHATAAEAYEHEKQHLLATRLRFFDDRPGAVTLHRCRAVGCNVFTNGRAEVGGYWHCDLCAEHRTPEEVALLLTVGESWES